MEKGKLKLYGYYLGIGLGIILVVAFITSQIIMPLMFGKPKSIEVPNLVSISSSQAKNILADKKLHSVVKDSTWSDEVERGFVVSQKPAAGDFIEPDGTVYLEISRGSKFVKVPELIGLNVQAAWMLLNNYNLRFVVADSLFSERYPVNTVVQSSPSAGERVERRTKIKLFISRGESAYADTLSTGDDYNY